MAEFKGVVKTCVMCRSEFKVPRCREATAITCSANCRRAYVGQVTSKPKVQLTCAHCKQVFETYPSHVLRRKYCSEQCRDSSPPVRALRREAATADADPNWKGGVGVLVVSSSGKTYKRQPPHIETEKVVRRKRAKAQATPAWANLSAIRDIYRLCREISERAGVAHHVDHIVPLTSKYVCGLHVEANLQIVPGIENLRKHNRTWPDKP